MIFKIALKDLKIVFRDKKALAVLLLMPVLIMLILGTTFGTMFSDELMIKKFTIGVINKDDGFISQIFINKVLRENLSDIFSMFVVDDTKATDMLKRKIAPVILIIPENFSRDIEKNKHVEIKIKSHINYPFESNIAMDVTKGFAENLSMGYAGAFGALNVLKRYGVYTNKPLESMSEATAIMSELQQNIKNTVVKFVETDQKKYKALSAMQYYSAAMLVMFLLFGVNTGTKQMVEERENFTLRRLLSTRINKSGLIIGKFLGLVFISFTQGIILILFTKFIYKVNWGNSFVAIILILLSTIFASAGFGMFISAVTKTSKAADGLGVILIQIFTLIGGGMVPLSIMPVALQKIAKISLNYWSLKALHNIMLGAGVNTVLPFAGILILMSIGYICIGVAKFKV